MNDEKKELAQKVLGGQIKCKDRVKIVGEGKTARIEVAKTIRSMSGPNAIRLFPPFRKPDSTMSLWIR